MIPFQLGSFIVRLRELWDLSYDIIVIFGIAV